MNVISRSCLSCNKPLRGRIDKKFCDDYCRNQYNNNLKGAANNYVRNINNALRRNRRILEELFPSSSGIVRVQRENLVRLGFQFRYFTHTYTNKKGHTYFYCYEFGYRPLEKDWFLLVKRKVEQGIPR